MELVEIDLTKTGKNKKGEGSCWNPEINPNGIYLAKIYDGWFAGPIDTIWYGYNFRHWGASGIQINSKGLTNLYRIEGLL